MRLFQEKKYIYMAIVLILVTGKNQISNYIGQKDTFGKPIIKYQNQLDISNLSLYVTQKIPTNGKKEKIGYLTLII